ncbi:hypothetical protein RJ639_019884 [Escallonia herrerae]|uniref:Non-haem dioxygenase N-terminal domain-containing protein n=1 Tax=Escallonia herrerae TaxID=1293975 RepID=A0AA88V9J6_9ASTE|nr:hypothetical protein RJ639_019884 [Escallonia herrerae]
MEVASRPIRVQSIAQSGAAPQVPPEYIQPPENRPNNPTARPANNNSIPSIDLSSAVRDAVFLRTEIGAACREWGTFHLTNHGVPPKLLNEIKCMGRHVRWTRSSGILAIPAGPLRRDWESEVSKHTLVHNKRNMLSGFVWKINAPILFMYAAIALLVGRFIGICIPETSGIPEEDLTRLACGRH